VNPKARTKKSEMDDVWLRSLPWVIPHNKSNADSCVRVITKINEDQRQGNDRDQKQLNSLQIKWRYSTELLAY